jgi:DNA repair photolyase
MNIDIEEINVKSVYTKTAIPTTEYVANPYVGCPHGCQYCYASFMKRFSKHKEDWGSFVDVKFWDKEPPKECKSLMISSVTDPYNPLEKKYKRTQAILQQLLDTHHEDTSLLIITKSDLVLRDLPLIKQFKKPRVAFSINTLDESFKDEMDHAVPIEKRIQAMKTLHNNGIRTICFISPIFPEITDVIAIINKVHPYANYIWLENLQLRGDYKLRILDYIKYSHPKLLPLYEKLYKGTIVKAKAYRREYWSKCWTEIKAFCEKNKIPTDSSGDSSKTRENDLKTTCVYNLLHDGSPAK